MRAQEVTRYLTIAALTLMVNLLLFIGWPNLLPKHVVDSDLETLQTVDFLRHNYERNDSEHKPTPEKPTPPAAAAVIPRKVMNPMAHPAPEQLKMALPAFDFDVPMELATDISDTPPLGLPQMALKDSYGMQEVDQTPVPMLRTQPDYPYRARRLNLNGKVDVKFLVDTVGGVSRIAILRADPKGLFDDSVIRALSSWRFSPGKVNGKPVNTWMTTTIEFRIDDP